MKKSYEKKLSLDMGFGDALRRFSKTDKNELEEIKAKSERIIAEAEAIIDEPDEQMEKEIDDFLSSGAYGGKTRDGL